MKSDWDRFTEEASARAEALGGFGMGSVTHSSYWWAWAVTQKGLLDQAVQGSILCFVLSFLVLTFTTGNIVLAV
eukprot:CAMPEP_0118953834 /NCGR_PEP_ID=MMETSP1169-20130426/57257_1 /TAXON_ID=36882 /ORGANISM="Pyramimonas obovata, Strain CCMP722" /LENGTH=73 /DNA_ID=CAMNT_0006901379 /DNA_START=1 /DNA_END=219 /DNA_ORIENTATION=+